jgi:hypothetical protein
MEEMETAQNKTRDQQGQLSRVSYARRTSGRGSGARIVQAKNAAPQTWFRPPLKRRFAYTMESRFRRTGQEYRHGTLGRTAPFQSTYKRIGLA